MEQKKRKHKSETYLCKRWRMLEFLISHNFQPIQTLVDPENPKYKVWRFKNTPEFEECVESYFEMLKGNQ